MNLPNNKFCVLPWISLEASPIGTVRPCCLADDEIVDDHGQKFQLSSSSFDTIQNSKHMKTLRQEFLDGKQPTTCRRCWSEERSGRTSKRMHTLQRLKHLNLDNNWTTDAKPLMFLDLKLGNICNLKCRICGSWSSSQFAAEELKFLPRQEQKSSFHYQMLRDGAWPRNSVDFWTELDKKIDQVRYIEFTGGEPFMIQEHFDLLRRLVESGHAGQVEIHYNTNGTQYPDYAEDIWKNFQHVEIAFSIDDVGSRFEYQRSGAVWAEVCENIEKFQRMRARNSNITLQVCCTVNVFNVLYLEYVADWIRQQNFDFVYWNMLHDAEYLSIASLPAASKMLIAKHFNEITVPEEFQQEFDRIVDFMNHGTSGNGEQLRAKIKELDDRRLENLKVCMPELAAVIDYD